MNLPLPPQLSSIGEKLRGVQWKWLVTAGVILLALAIGITQIQGPWQQRRAQLQSRYAEEWQRGKLTLSLHAQGNRLVKQEQTILFPGEARDLTGEVTRLASEAGLQVDSVIPQTAGWVGPYKRSQIQVAGTTTFVGLLKFLRAVEKHDPLLRAEQVTLNRSSTNSKRHQVELLISSFSRQGAAP